jgi:hypothetical protein
VPQQDLGLEPAYLTAQRPQLSSYAMESRSGMDRQPILIFMQSLQASRYSAGSDTSYDPKFRHLTSDLLLWLEATE